MDNEIKLKGWQLLYDTVKKIIQTPEVIFIFFLLVGAGHYSSFM